MYDTGIYAISSPSGKLYIGSAGSLKSRKRTHLWALRKNRHHSKRLQGAWNKYGDENIVFKPLVVCRRCDLLFYEQLFIDALKPSYNVRPLAGRTAGAKMPQVAEANRRRIWTDEARKKHSEILKALHFDPSKPPKGPKMSREQVAEFHRGRKRSPETCARISAAKKAYFETDPSRSKPVAEANRRRVYTDDDREKCRLRQTGRKHTPETLAKMSAAQVLRRKVEAAQRNRRGS